MCIISLHLVGIQDPTDNIAQDSSVSVSENKADCRFRRRPRNGGSSISSAYHLLLNIGAKEAARLYQFNRDLCVSLCSTALLSNLLEAITKTFSHSGICPRLIASNSCIRVCAADRAVARAESGFPSTMHGIIRYMACSFVLKLTKIISPWSQHRVRHS